MIPFGDDTWTPSRELLAAFADGELDNRPHLAQLLSQIETWLAAHPEAMADLEMQLDLNRLMTATSAASPSSGTWDLVWHRVLKAPPTKVSRWKLIAAVAGTAAAAAIVLAVLRPSPSAPPAAAITAPAPPPEQIAQGPLEVLEVATADEVEILRVGGADTTSLINVNVPLTCPIELLARHEVEFRTPANNAAGTEIRQAGSAPVVWTPLPGERDEEDLS